VTDRALARPSSWLRSMVSRYHMKLQETDEMAYPRKYVEHIFLGLEDPLNQHLIKLAGFDFPPEQRQHFRAEIRSWLNKLQRLRMKPNNRTGSFKFYYDLLFDYPFGGVELQNMRILIQLIAEQYPNVPATKSPEELVAWLKQFHTRLAERLHNGEAVLDMLPE
jgi:hypothetical protein